MVKDIRREAESYMGGMDYKDIRKGKKVIRTTSWIHRVGDHLVTCATRSIRK